VGASKCLPRIFLGCLEGQGHALAVQVHLENLDGNGLANLDNLGRVVDVLPGQLGDVNQAADTSMATRTPIPLPAGKETRGLGPTRAT